MEKYINGSTAYNYGSAVPYESPYSQPKTGIREVPKTHKKDNSRVFARLIAFYLCIIFLVSGGIVYSKVLLMQGQTNIENLEEQVAALTEKNNAKKIQIEQKIDLKKIEEIAISQYGMQRPDKNQTVYVNVVQSDYAEIIEE